MVKHDQLHRFAGNDYRFDNCGNQISCLGKGNKQQRVYNGFNQLTQLNHNGKLTHYEYDALGRRSAKITEQGRIDFIWDNNQLIGEHHNGKFTWFIYQPDTFLPVALIKSASGEKNSEVYYYHIDQLGTPICLSDNKAEQVWRNSSDAFGCQQEDNSEDNEDNTFTNLIENPLRFQGQYFDEESKLHYNRFRYYDPKQQRFINQDPIGLVGGINPYQYAPNPVNWIDPFGLSCKELPAAEESASYQGQDPYFGIDPLDNIAIPKHTMLAHITWKEKGGITGNYFTTPSAVEVARSIDGYVSSKALNQGVQVYAGDDRTEYKKYVQIFEVQEDIPYGSAAFGVTKANPQFNPGRYQTHEQYFIQQDQLNKLTPVPGSLETMKNTEAPNISKKLEKLRAKKKHDKEK